ncbi:MAG: trimethylamine methyltransferase family protein [Actinobacteria bacterium]|nr:trimethylamine methyltransferase family protein [Actinomycetota bacterium]
MTETAPETVGRGRRGGRERTEGSRNRLPEQLPFRQPQMRLNHTEVVSPDELESIHEASLTILERIGLEFLDPESRSLMREAGADVDETNGRVRFPRELVLAKIALAPAEFTLHSWNPAHHLRIGGRWMAYGTVGSAPHFIDRQGVRRTGDREGFRDLLKLAQMLNTVHFIGGYPVEPVDLHHSVRHIHAAHDVLTLTDKSLHCYSLGRQRNRDVIEMARISRGIDDATLLREPSVFTVVNSNSPLRLDTPMSQGMIEFARHNQPIVMTPFTLAGAMAPITLAGALAQQNAEALAGVTFIQCINPGAPAVYGGFTSNVDMQSGAPAFGTPEYVKTAMVGGQLARRYALPYRSSNVCAANALDAQAAYESVFSLWGCVMGGVNFMMHGAGWMEGGLHASLDKMVLDADLLQMVTQIMDPIAVDEASLAIDTIDEVGPGGHFFGTQHTQDRFRTAFYKPLISDWRNYESWQEAGSPQAPDKVKVLVERFLAAYEPPAMDPAIRAELDAFVERRVAEGGVPTDY